MLNGYGRYLIVVVMLLIQGCAAKIPVRPMRGSATAHYDLNRCRQFKAIYGAIKCDGVILVPNMIDAGEVK